MSADYQYTVPDWTQDALCRKYMENEVPEKELPFFVQLNNHLTSVPLPDACHHVKPTQNNKNTM